MNFGSGAGGGATAGPDLQDVQTEQLAFQAVLPNGTLRLLSTPWPESSLPPPTASLLSVASSKGLVAAAGPDALVIAKTDSVRKTLIEGPSGENGVKSFQPEATINVPRVSQVCFSSDESCLVITAEQGGGLAVYDTNAIVNGGKDSAFQLSTNGQSIKQLVPNPNPTADLSRYFALVTEQGQLLLADLKEQKLVNTAGGSTVFHENVYCACWSRLGKQIIAGRRDGTAVQIDPQGTVKATIPEPPQLAEWKNSSSDGHPLSSIYWLDTNDFLLIHTPVNSPNSMAEDDSIYHLARREKPSSQSWTFSKFSDPCPAFGADRKPAHHFIQRLREWPPDLSDMLVLASTASSDPGAFTKSKAPLNSDHPVVDAWTTTMPPDDGRLAMPMSVGSGGDTSPVGMAVDLSTKEKTPRPIPTDETLEQSPVELPVLYILNQEGNLSAWYIVYRPSVRQAVRYPDLITAGGPRPLSEQKQQTPAPASQPTSGPPAGLFGSASMSSPPPSQPVAASASPAAAAFGGASALGSAASPWGSSGAAPSAAPAFGKPSFGAPSLPGSGSAFGNTSALGASRSSPWGAQPQTTTQSATAGTGSVFGGSLGQQSGFAGAAASSKPTASPFAAFGNAGGDKPAASPFAAFGSAGGNKPAASPFAAFGSGGGDKPTTSPFAAFGSGGADKPTPSPFAAAAANGTKEGQTNAFGSKPNLSAEPSGSTVSFGSFSMNSGSFGTASSFGKPSAPSQNQPSGANSTFGSGSSGFTLGSTFKGDGSAKDDLPKPKDAGAGLFGKSFGSVLGEVKTTPDQPVTPIKKEPGTEDEPNLADIPAASTTPASPPSVDDAPLPPDPATWKPKPGALPPPIPPGFGDAFAPKAAKEQVSTPSPADAPLPPDFTLTKPQDKPLAGSPPLDLGDSQSDGLGSEDGGPAEEDEGEEWSDEEEEEDNGDESEEQETEFKASNQGALDAFKARIGPVSPNSQAKEDDATTPATDKKSSYTPAGLPKAPILFPPPNRAVNGSPRSPSPVRSATSPFRLGTQTQQRKPSSQLPPIPTPTAKAPQPPQRIAVPPAQLVQKERSTSPPKPSQPEAGDLEDEEDARIQEVLASAVEPTKDLPPFLAHQDYVGGLAGPASSSDKPGLGGQIERVYRDINSMIDTLALNARSLNAFVRGHLELRSSEERTREDLEDEENWSFDEIVDLGNLVEGVEEELEDGRLDDVRGKMERLWTEEAEMGRVRSRGADVKKQVLSRTDPEQSALHAAAGLPMEAQAQQAELRQSVQKVQALMAKAEEQLSLLRAELASASQKTGGSNGTAVVPTVEAVSNTILKMTAMIEKKSGDIDVLESQLRRLGGPAVLRPGKADNYEDDLASALKASRLSHGSPVASRSVASRWSGYASALYDSPSARKSSPGQNLRSSRIGPDGLRKSLFDVSQVEMDAYVRKKERRRNVCAALREQIEARGARVVKVGES